MSEETDGSLRPSLQPDRVALRCAEYFSQVRHVEKFLKAAAAMAEERTVALGQRIRDIFKEMENIGLPFVLKNKRDNVFKLYDLEGKIIFRLQCTKNDHELKIALFYPESKVDFQTRINESGNGDRIVLFPATHNLLQRQVAISEFISRLVVAEKILYEDVEDIILALIEKNQKEMDKITSDLGVDPQRFGSAEDPVKLKTSGEEVEAILNDIDRTLGRREKPPVPA